MANFLDRIGDMFVPKEIAPYLGMIAPMVAPQLGIAGSLALSQLGSFKERGGRFDPYSALATGIALSSPHARNIRRAGRIDPSRGTIGQRMSAGFANSLAPGPGESASGLFRALDPRMSIGQNTYLHDTGHEFKSFYESPTMARAAATSATPIGNSTGDGLFPEMSDYDFNKTLDKDIAYKKGIKAQVGDNWEFPEESSDRKKADRKRDWDALSDGEQKQFMEEYKQGNLTDEEFAEYLSKPKDEQAAYLKSLDNRYTKGVEDFDVRYGKNYVSTVGEKPKWYETAADYGSEIAGAILPGFSQYDDQGRRIPETFSFTKAIQTIGVASTLGSVMALKEELEKEELKDKSKERELWNEWFKSYERTAGHTYENSPYREDHLWNKYQEFMMANGGRVGYNMGGGIMEAPGVPQGMQLDGREGAFVSQGIEEKADDVPAMLSKNEFVLTADAMRGLDRMMGGSGDPRAAAKYMYQTMDQLEAMA